MWNQKHERIGVFPAGSDDEDVLEPQDLSAATVHRALVCDCNNEVIGQIDGLQISIDGRITGAVIEVHGVPDQGQPRVLLPFRDLTVLRQAEGAGVRIRLHFARDRIGLLPPHDDPCGEVSGRAGRWL